MNNSKTPFLDKGGKIKKCKFVYMPKIPLNQKKREHLYLALLEKEYSCS